MAGLVKPAYQGMIVVESGVNDTIAWNEETGLGGYNLDVTIAAGTYHLTDLLDTIIAAMSADSDANGVGGDYAGVGGDYAYSIDYSTGIITLSVTHPSAAPPMTFYPKIKTTETQKLLTGGDQSVGTNADPHLGWNVDAAYPATSAAHAADEIHSFGWYPSQPIEEDDEGPFSSAVAESVSMGGSVVAYDFSGSTVTYLGRRAYSYRYLTAADRSSYETNFWAAHAKQGSPDGRYKFIPDRATPATYETHILTEESLKSAPFARSSPGTPHWSLSIVSRIYKP